MLVLEKSRGYIQVFLDGGLNQQKMGVINQESALRMYLLERMGEKFIIRDVIYCNNYVANFLLMKRCLSNFIFCFLKICDAVTVAKILNATLVIPHLEVNPVWQDSRYFVSKILQPYLQFIYSFFLFK